MRVRGSSLSFMARAALSLLASLRFALRPTVFAYWTMKNYFRVIQFSIFRFLARRSQKPRGFEHGKIPRPKPGFSASNSNCLTNWRNLIIALPAREYTALDNVWRR